MDRQRWRQIESIYQVAIDKAVDDRQAYLDQACADDADLRSEVEALLAVHESQDARLEVPALEHVAQAHRVVTAQLLTGQRLGPYEVLSLLGKGGMGEVYLARDTKLDRQVAIKVLPAEVAEDPERLRRFVREAKAASALDHPNIATIFEIDEAEGIHYLVMEYVKGETLEARIRHRRPELAEMLGIAIQTADALEAANGKGIIHRDIKPANLMLTPRRQVKVLDFGLAKRFHPAAGPAATAVDTESETTPGVIMGTVEYMSPEQVLGQEVDHRTDLFSLGVVLYNMVTGRLPFRGATRTDTMYQILHGEPEAMARLNQGIPAELELIVRKCLEKDRGLRYQHASDLLTDLKRLKRDADSGKVDAEVVGAKPRRLWLWAAPLLLMAMLVALSLWFFRAGTETLELPMVPVPLTTYRGLVGNCHISPDGAQVAFVWNREKEDNFNIYIKQIGSETPRRLTDDPHEDSFPRWSPDGLTIAFLRDLGAGKRAVMLIPVNGGRARPVAEFQDMAGICWHPVGKWLAAACKDSPSEPPAIVLLSPETGEKRRLTFPSKGSRGDADPAFSPDGGQLAFSRSFGLATTEILVLRLSAKLEPEGEPRQLTFGDRTAMHPAWMPDGRELVFVYGSNLHRCGLWRVATSGSGKPRPLPFSGEGSSVFYPSLSLKNHRLVYALWSSDFNVWRYQIPGSQRKPAAPSRFFPSSQTQEVPQYSPDAKEVVYISYASDASEIWISSSDGSNPPAVNPLRWSRSELSPLVTRWKANCLRYGFQRAV